uniref:SAM domain-containing protein n=1 Tax=Ditylenchus dipsaci TaxID=166011 RepID=A0A915CR90_9BILA
MKRCPIPNEVERWAHSCVVQWLKSIDLSEFTPNLMFSGLHGALMIHEPTFSADCCAKSSRCLEKEQTRCFVDPDVPVCPSSANPIQDQVIESFVDSSEMTEILIGSTHKA